MTEEEIQVKALELSALSLAALPEQEKTNLINANEGFDPLAAVQLVVIKNTLRFEEKLRHIFGIEDPSQDEILP